MPADDLVLNVRQIVQYPDQGVQAADAFLLQRGGLGGPYLSTAADQIVSQALSYGTQPLIVGVPAPADSDGSQVFAWGVMSPIGGSWIWNGYLPLIGGPITRIATGPVGKINFDPATGGWQFAFAPSAAQSVPIDSTWVDSLNIDGSGYLTVGNQILLNRDPVLPMEAATAQWVNANSVSSFNGRTGAITLWIDDILCAGGAPIFSPVFQGTPRAITPPPTSNSSRLATTAFVQNAVMQGIDLSAYAPLDSPAFSGVPSAPTPPPSSSDGQLATTAFVQNAITASTTGVASWNTRTGAVVLTTADVTGVGGALLASPVFTGVPAAPTATAGTNTTQLATTAFVTAAIASMAAGVASFNSRTGAVVLTSVDVAAVGVSAFNGRIGSVNLIANDISAVGGALLASPALTGVPTAPTAAAATSTTQLATTAFVAAAITALTWVTSFNSRTGAVTLTAADLTGAGGMLKAGVTDGSNAAAGQVGEYMIATVPQASMGSVPNGALFGITQVDLSAGDWQISGYVAYVPGYQTAGAGVTLGQYYAMVSNTAASFGSVPPGQAQGIGGLNVNCAAAVPIWRLNVTAPTSVYLNGWVSFSGGNNQCGAYGWIAARRMR